MSDKIFIEVDAGKEQPEDGQYFVIMQDEAGHIAKDYIERFAGMWMCDRYQDEDYKVIAFLRPIQQQEGLAQSVQFIKWFVKDSVVFFDEKGNLYDPLTDEIITPEQLFEQFINSIKR
jgi:hypothetical protein